ncbi:hypothetical protein E3N88_39371 [Mikania micrantha]|uniref:ZF-HD dimerization-type domain-containing protein n=1 Tax=Mikania micrantha TaxID=192012 RepID=A0A5N6LWJ8_9ASTR|nr:hypothetical protein E3N88_39371 [Mikania micrantha]
MKKRSQVVVKKSSSNRTLRGVRYGECQKNHAANIGAYAVDGCREFMAGGEEGSAAALTCAACGCHRSFHRKHGNEPGCSQVSSMGHQLANWSRIWN